MRVPRYVWAALGICACSEGAGTAPDARDLPPLPPPPPARAPVDLALAADLPAQCKGPEIFRITRPISSADPAHGHYSYGFRFKPPGDPASPVLVYLPGGPGMTSTDAPPDFLPASWGYLLTDPRGVGCNTLAAVPDETVSGLFFRTDEIANDVVAAIADRHLEAYVLYGISYGTVLGANVASKLAAAPPRAIVFEGVVGRAFRSGEYVGAAGIALWDSLRASMPDDVVHELDTSPSPFGIPPEGWSRALGSLLLGGANVDTLLFDALSGVDPLQDQALAQIRSYANTPVLTSPGAVELYRQVACRELDASAPKNDLDPVFVAGKLVRDVADEGTKCRPFQVTTPFDSAAYAFAPKVFYFIGDTDVAAPKWQGDYAFDNHRGHAVRVVAKGGGHLSLQLDQQPCASAVLESIAKGGPDLRDVLSTCPTPVNVDEK
jgi:hypothetical protein